MSEQIITILRSRLDELSDQGDPEARRNALKEALQFFVLNFIYHHPRYSKWIMYGGSVLRIVHNLDRMSVDLDFEVSHAITKKFLLELKEEMEHYFVKTYNTDTDFLDVKTKSTRGLTLKFHVGGLLDLGFHSKQVRVEVDLNHFVVPKAFTERRPVNRGRFSFAILTYNLSGLMASKIAAIYLRGTRVVGETVYEEKGRDIYDLLWYMEQKVVPDFDYLAAKKIDATDLRALFDELTLKMNTVSDENLEQDLAPLFTDRVRIENWLVNWRTSFLHLIDEYHIRTVVALDRVLIDMDFYTDNYSFTYLYQTEEKDLVRIVCNVSDYWVEFREGDLPVDVDENLIDKVGLSDRWSHGTLPSERMKKYVMLFHGKIEAYFKKVNKVILSGQITTKLIRMTADNFNPREQIILNPSALLSCKLEDLLQ